MTDSVPLRQKNCSFVTEALVDPTAGLDVLEKRKILYSWRDFKVASAKRVNKTKYE
jgi:hypothetical protein